MLHPQAGLGPSGSFSARGPARPVAGLSASTLAGPSGALTARGPAAGALSNNVPSGLAPGAPGAQGPQGVVGRRKTPSERLAEGRQGAHGDVCPKIVSFLNLSHFSHHTDSVVPVDEPLFKPMPPVIHFLEFEGLQTFDATLNLRNQDTVARRVKVLPPDSAFFEVLPGRGRKVAAGGDKVAPGMEVSYIIRFKPDATVDNYEYDLEVVTERERFTVPVRATGGSAVLELPDRVDFGAVPVRYESSKTVLIRNIGEKATKFLLKTAAPFTTSHMDGYLEVGASMQLEILFRPERADHYERELAVVYGDGIEVGVALVGSAENIDVTFSTDRVCMNDTFIALSTQSSVVIHNRSDVPVDFSWRAFPTIEDEIGQKLKLQLQLKHEENEEMVALRDDNAKLEEEGEELSESSESLSETSDENEDARSIKRNEDQVVAPLTRRYRNIAKSIMEDPMFFYDEIFAVEPLAGRIWAKSKTTVTITFTPKAALNYQCIAFCSIVGRAERLQLYLKGQGIGPKAAFSYDELDVGDIFVESVHQYEVDLINQGDIAVNFQLVPNTSPFGSKFNFSPSHGRLEVGSQCTIVVEFCPDLLGEFLETFHWDLVGSTSSIPLTFKGHSVSPTFHFDFDRISFGVVSYGFLNSKTLTLTNTSEVTMRFALRIPGDGRFAQKEFDVIPPRGTLLPNCSQKVQIDFISVNVKTYDLCLVVDLEGVGQELASIPIQARCAVPSVSFDPPDSLEYGEIFIRYPAHQTLVFNNTSALPAKFQILPQDESSRSLAEFEPDQASGSVPPSSSHVVTFTLTAYKLGPLQIPINIRVLGHNSLQQLLLTANSIGPIVIVEPAVLDWGNVRCLEPVPRQVRVTNSSVIDASIKAFMKTKGSLWNVSPKNLQLKPYESKSIDLTLIIDEAMRMQDVLHLVVEEGEDRQVTVKAKGLSTPVTCKEPLTVIDFGAQYTTQSISKEFFIENRGRKPRKLQWMPEAALDTKAAKSGEGIEPSIFTVTPDVWTLEAKHGLKYQFDAMCITPKVVSEKYVCLEYVGSERKGRVVFKSEICGHFVAPLLELSEQTLSFKFMWERHKPIAPIGQSLHIKNTSPLDIKFFLKVQPPFHVNVESLFLRPDEGTVVLVEFDPAFKVDRNCGVIKQKLSLVYQDHPQKDFVNLVGEVVFPNIVLSVDKLDFGAVLNETSKQMTVTMENPHPLPVNYNWMFVEEVDINADLDAAGFATGGADGNNSIDAGSVRQSLAQTPIRRGDGDDPSHEDGASRGPKSMMTTATGGLGGLGGTMAATNTNLIANPPVDINQIFDILPIMGTLESGEKQIVTITYFGLSSQKFEATAVCQAEGGPEYELQLKGLASKLEFRIDKLELDFGSVLFNQVLEKEIYITNTGKVAYYYSFNLSGMSRPFVIDANPMAGLINPDEKQKIVIRFRAGIPDEVNETILVEVAHFEPTKIKVRGQGIFPGILVSATTPENAMVRLHRIDEEEHLKRRAQAQEHLLAAKAAGLKAIMDAPPPQEGAAIESEHGSSQELHENDIEFEVDRNFLCEELLAQEQEVLHSKTKSMKASQQSSKGIVGATRVMKDMPPITAAYYRCDFGHIVLGQSGKRVMSIYNCFMEPISFSINRKILGNAGFAINPDKVKKLPPGKSLRLEVSCFRSRDVEEGEQFLDWIIPLKSGPKYSIHLVADFVLPDLVLSSDHVDFGHVLVGQVKRTTIKLRNVKAVPVEWEYKAPRSKYGKPLAPWETAFTLSPSSGRLQSGETAWVVVGFMPNGAKSFNEKFALRLVDNPNKKILSLHGVGDALRVEVKPSNEYSLGPILPGKKPTTQEFFLHNPTDYPIMVYSVDFDQKYLQEESMLQQYNKYSSYNLVEFPVRDPDAETWAPVVRHSAKLQRRQERIEAKAQAKQERMERRKAAQEAAQEQLAAEGGEPTPEQGGDAAAKDGAEPSKEEIEEEEEEDEPEIESDSEAEPGEAGKEELEMDPADFPIRVPDEDRLNVLVLGPALTGKSSLAAAVAEADGRKVIRIDDVVDWALGGPPSLKSESETQLRDRLLEVKAQADEQHELAEKQRETAATKAKQPFVPQAVRYTFPVEDVQILVKKRLNLPDCNCGIIFDGVRSKYLESQEQGLNVVVNSTEDRLIVLCTGLAGQMGFSGQDPISLGDGKLPAVLWPPPPEEDGRTDEDGGAEDGAAPAASATEVVEEKSREEQAQELLQGMMTALKQHHEQLLIALQASAGQLSEQAAALQAELAELGEEPPEDIPAEAAGAGAAQADGEPGAGEEVPAAKSPVQPTPEELQALEQRQQERQQRKALQQRIQDLEKLRASVASATKVLEAEKSPAPGAPGGPGATSPTEELTAALSRLDAVARERQQRLEERREAKRQEEELAAKRRQHARHPSRKQAGAQARPSEVPFVPPIRKDETALPGGESIESMQSPLAEGANPEQLEKEDTPPPIKPAKEPVLPEQAAMALFALPFDIPDASGTAFFQLLKRLAKEACPKPLVPDELPLPPPSFSQIVARPTDRPKRVPPVHFSILTPDESGEADEGQQDPAAIASANRVSNSAGSATRPRAVTTASADGDGASPTPETPPPAPPSRWLIPPHSDQRLLLKFLADDIGDFSAALGFEVVGGINNNAPISVAVTGTTAYPAISTDPRSVFMRRLKSKPASGYASKHFIASLNAFDFGPLLAGRSVEAYKQYRQQEKKRLEDPEAAAPPGTAKDKHLLKHVEALRITNSGPYPAKVSFAMESTIPKEEPPSEAPPPPPAGKKGAAGKEEPPKNTFDDFPFIVEPAELELDLDETKEVRICCFPVREGTFSDTIVATVQDNPEAARFPITAIGTKPKVNLDITEVDFDRLLLKQQDMKVLKVSNICAVPVKWQLVPPSAGIPAPFQVNPATLEGIIGVAQDQLLNFSFKASEPSTHKFNMKLKISDTEGLNDPVEVQDLPVSAEAFSVDVVPEFPNNATGLDFGNIRVGLPVEQTFTVTNQGKYAVNFEVKVRRKAIREILEFDYGSGEPIGVLDPGQKKSVRVVCRPSKEMQCPDPHARSGIRVDELDLAVFESKTGDPVKLDLPPISLSFKAMFNSFAVTPPRGLNFAPVKMGESGVHEFELYNDGMFKFDWFLFDPSKPAAEDGSRQPEKGELSLGPFRVQPSEGQLNPKESMKVQVKFLATEDQHYDCKMGISVEGMSDVVAVKKLVGAEMDTTTQGFFAGTTAGKESGFREYLLTAQSCTPGIDTENVATIFEEQFVAPTLEDAIATAGRIDIRAFSEDEKVFSFGPVIVQAPTSETVLGDGGAKFRITNPKSIPCEVKLDIKARDATSKDALPFDLSLREMTIPPHEYRYVKVRFKPSALKSYSATFEASVPAGKDPKTNLLQFELRGSGTSPSVTLEGPPRFGDSGGNFHCGRLQVGKEHIINFTLRNDGIIPATARYEILQASSHFDVVCPRSIPLEPKAQQRLQLRFHPKDIGDLDFSVRVWTLHNPFEDTTIKFSGNGYAEEVAWDLKDVPRVAPDSEEPSAAQVLPPAPDEVDLGSVAVGDKVSVYFQISNKAATPIRFEFPETLPDPYASVLRISPSVGHVQPKERKTITVTFEPTSKLDAAANIEANIAHIKYEGEPEDWDDTMKKADFSTSPPVSPRSQRGSAQRSLSFAASEQGKMATADEDGLDGDGLAMMEEPPNQIVTGTEKTLPLKVQAKADDQMFECEATNVYFAPTVLFQTRTHRFVVRNPSVIPLPITWRFNPKVPGSQVGGLKAYTVTPAQSRIAPGREQEFTVRFSPTEVDHFAGVLRCDLPHLPSDRPPLQLDIDASALRPWCHFELPQSDYRSRRQADSVLDPKYQIMEFESLGTRIKNTKRFYVLNPTSESYEFLWKLEESEQRKEDDAFRCVTKRGTILSGKKYEMVFEYMPTTVGTHESTWTFSVLGKNAVQSFLLAGAVKEPRIGTDRPNINFARLLLGANARETISIVNKEHIPFAFTIATSSYEIEGQVPVINVSPLSGVVSPGASFPLEVAFRPSEEKSYNFNIICNVKRRDKPLLINVKGEGYKIHTKMVLEDKTGDERLLHPGVVELLDFGEMQVQEQRSYTLRLSSPGYNRADKTDADQTSETPAQRYDFVWELRHPTRGLIVPRSHAPPYLTISPMHGVATQLQETLVTVAYTPFDQHDLEGTYLRMSIPSSPGEPFYNLKLSGHAKRPNLDFSVSSHDFGACFVKKGTASSSMADPTSPTMGSTPYERLDLVVSNRDVVDCWLATTYQRTSYLDVQLQACMVESGKSVVVPIIFTPRDYMEYRERVEFIINDSTKAYVALRGRGCELQLELASMAMHNVDFGVTVGNQPVNRSVKVVNRSEKAVEFQLFDPDHHLTEKGVTWTPLQSVVLRPKELLPIELRFNPSNHMAPFKLPLMAKTTLGQDVHLVNVSGTCHTAEVKLSEHSLLFGDVVFQSTGMRHVKLHNFGDLGVKFRFEVPPRVSQLFSVSPSSGFAAPHTDVSLVVQFHPVRGGSGPEGAAIGREAEQGKPKRIRCTVEPAYQQDPVELIVQGRGVEQPEGAVKTLDFTCAVREKVTEEITFPPDGKNPSNEPWKLNPILKTEVPNGVDYWFCPAEVVVPPGGQTKFDIAYRPLTMTLQDEDRPQQPDDSGGEEGTNLAATATRRQQKRPRELRPEQHKGSVFLATPDGNLHAWSLTGRASAPSFVEKLQATVQCKTTHVQGVEITNWLRESQRFSVKLSLVEPQDAGDEIRLHGVDSFDLPPGQRKEYKFNVFAYREGRGKARVVFSNPKTEEYYVAEVEFQFVTPQHVGEIKFSTACRQQASHPISIANPLPSPVVFTCEASLPEFRFSPADFTVPATSEGTVDVLFQPLLAGSGTASVKLSSKELGDYPYTVSYEVKPAGLEKAPVFKAPLGSTETIQTFKFLHYAKKPVTYSAKIEAAPGHKAPASDFLVETKAIQAPAAGDEPVEVSVDIRFQPSQLGEIRTLLVLASPEGGDYKALLVGYAQPPQPQGPVYMQASKPGEIEFTNPFEEAVEFSLQVDNPTFTVASRTLKIEGKKAAKIPIQFKSDQKQRGCLIIMASKVTTPWKYFLEGSP